MGDCCLKKVFAKLYQISNIKETTVASAVKIWGTREEEDHKLKWTRKLRQWEKEEADMLDEIIQSVVLTSEEDRLAWDSNAQGYSVKLAASHLNTSSYKVEWDFIWKIKIPYKVKIFLWKVHLRILHTKVFLAHRKILKNDSILCPSCGMGEESVEHLFLNCGLAKTIWCHLFQWWQINPMMQDEFSLLNIWCQHNQFSLKKAKVAWRISVSAVLWCLWLARNKVIFEGKRTGEAMLVNIIKLQAKEWCIAFKVIHVKTSDWWKFTPMGALTSSERIQIKEIKESVIDLVCFIDGSCKKKGNEIKSGFGGVIYNRVDEIIFKFSGPSTANSPFLAEWEGFIYMINAFCKSSWKDHSITLFSDCISLVKRVIEILAVDNSEEFRAVREMARSIRLDIKYIPSEITL